MKRYFKSGVLALAVLAGAWTIAEGQGRVNTTSGVMYLRSMASNLLFSPDNTYDIGASGASRPSRIYAATAMLSPLFQPASEVQFGGGTSTRVSAPSDGLLLLRNLAGTDFSRLQFGGTTSSFPALKRNGSLIEARLADDSSGSGFIAGGGLSLISNTGPTSNAVLFTERADPSAPSANQALLYVRDNGAGKTEIVVRFASGAVQVIATEP